MKPEFGDDDLIVENRVWGKKRAEDEKDADEDEEIFAYWCHLFLLLCLALCDSYLRYQHPLDNHPH